MEVTWGGVQSLKGIRAEVGGWWWLQKLDLKHGWGRLQIVGAVSSGNMRGLAPCYHYCSRTLGSRRSQRGDPELSERTKSRDLRRSFAFVRALSS